MVLRLLKHLIFKVLLMVEVAIYSSILKYDNVK